MLLTKLLRLDIDHHDFPADPRRSYAIPPTFAEDLNRDGVLDFDDINPFVVLLSGG